MSVNKTYLPEKDTDEFRELVSVYSTASDSELEEMASKYGYKNRKNFVDSMRRVLGVRHEQAQPPRDGGSNIPLKLPKRDKPQIVAVINDTQNPFQDTRCMKVVESILFEVQPDYLIYNGDICDFYQISKFDKDPARIVELQGDVDNTKCMFHRHHILLPSTKKILIAGNHEDRWQRFLWTQASALSSLKCLTLTELFSLSSYDIDFVPYECGLMINDIFLVIHGDIASVHSGYTAKRLYEKHGGCGICGHCHRGGSYYKRDRFGTWGWWENFCLCSLNPDWIKNPNWTQGFSLVHFHGKRFWVEQIPIIDGACMYGGRKFE